MFKAIIGLEVHIELSTKSKMFCACSADHFAKKPNTQVCPICLGLPGALPFANQEAIKQTLRLGLAFNCQVNRFSKFDRKHYFYPDLPKGYQISQYDIPLCVNGQWSMANGQKILIRRVHLEEDTAKMVHQTLRNKEVSLIDFNRSGVPLVEIVTEPDFDNAVEVVQFLRQVQLLARYLQISSCDMEKGSMRLEANVSLLRVKEPFDSTQGKQEGRRIEVKLPDYKVELKNINSFRFLEKAINSEIERQKEILEEDGSVVQETRGFSEKTGQTYSQRTKEEAKDYRYFPEPDIPALTFSDQEIESLRKTLPELPWVKAERFKQEFGLSDVYIDFLVQAKELSDYFEEAVNLGKEHQISVKTIADLMVNKKLHQDYPEPAGLIKKINELFQKDYSSAKEVETAVKEVIMENKKAISDYQKGKGQVIGFLIGQVQKRLRGKGDSKIVREMIISLLHNR